MKPNTKTCRHCGEAKSTAGFSKEGKGLRSWCKLCDAARSRQYYAEHRLERTTYQQDYYFLNREESINRAERSRLKRKHDIKEESNYKLDPIKFKILTEAEISA
jgi:hypothetical protein